MQVLDALREAIYLALETIDAASQFLGFGCPFSLRDSREPHELSPDDVRVCGDSVEFVCVEVCVTQERERPGRMRYRVDSTYTRRRAQDSTDQDCEEQYEGL